MEQEMYNRGIDVSNIMAQKKDDLKNVWKENQKKEMMQHYKEHQVRKDKLHELHKHIDHEFQADY